jgi:hypothetical protein
MMNIKLRGSLLRPGWCMSPLVTAFPLQALVAFIGANLSWLLHAALCQQFAIRPIGTC